MLSKLLQFLGALSVVVVPVLLGFYLARASPDVRYTLSEKIPVTFTDTSDSSPETVQQLEVRNIGNSQANQVVVKINGEITDYSLEKHSAADVARLFDDRQPFELVYPELPPQAGFRLVFTSPGDGINDADLEISHDSGVAQEALSESSQGNRIGWVVYLLGTLFYIVLIARSLRESLIDSWKSTARGRDPKQILHMKRPWYVLDSEWTIMPISALKESIASKPLFWDRDIRKLPAYQFLELDMRELDENPE